MQRSIIILISTLLVAGVAYAAPAQPADVSARWTSTTTATLSWDQQSDATWVCINGWDEQNIGVFRQCEATAAGPHMMTMTPGHVSDLQYYDIVEWAGPPEARTLYGYYQSYPLYRERVLLPFVR